MTGETQTGETQLTAFGRPLPIPADERLGEWPILAVAAACWEADRRRAFAVIYRAMRHVDDLVDERRKQGRRIPDAERSEIERDIAAAMGRIDSDGAGCAAEELVAIKQRFSLPDWPFERWMAAMMRDVRCGGFESWREFHRYSLGAAAAPGAIFLHLAAAPENGSAGRYDAPPFDVDAVSRPLAFFAYAVHLLRDFRKDQIDGLNPFPRAVLARCGLEPRQLRLIVEQGPRPGDTWPAGVGRLVRTYCSIAAWYRRRARRAIDATAGLLDPPARLSVEIVYELYLQLLERASARLSTGLPDLSVTPAETRERVARVIARVETAYLASTRASPRARAQSRRAASRRPPPPVRI